MTNIASIPDQCATVQMSVLRGDFLEEGTVMCTGRANEKVSINPGFTGNNVHFIADKVATKNSIKPLVGNNNITVRASTCFGAMFSYDATSRNRDGIDQEGFLVSDHLGSQNLCAVQENLSQGFPSSIIGRTMDEVGKQTGIVSFQFGPKEILRTDLDTFRFSINRVSVSLS